MKTFLLTLICLISLNINAQIVSNLFQNEFNQAYVQYPQVPRGVLEGVAFTQTHFKHIQTTEQGCIGIPVVSGVMGLTENGAGYFRNNLGLVAQLSGFTVNSIKQNPSTNILGYAKAYAYLVDSLNLSSDINTHDVVLKSLSEIPWDHNAGNNFALNTFVYQVLDFVKSSAHQQTYNFPNQNVNLQSVFSINNYAILSSHSITINDLTISNSDNLVYQPQYKSSEYTPALWVATPTCNRSSRNGTAVTAVTIHTIQGTYAGAISWAQNCSANVSYHYVERSSDGQVTQMVLETHKAWHVGSHNPYTIGIEHEGYVNDASWYTSAMIQSSANLVRDITASGYGINPLRTFYGAATPGVNVLGACTTIKGHQHYTNNTHTDPGINWDWEAYYKLINNTPLINSFTTTTGTIYDTGGSDSNYSSDEREFYLIEPTGATSVTLSFSVFDIEQDWDFMYIYDGNSINSPLIGIFTGTANPITITSTTGSVLIEFRSDCATTAQGWTLDWISTIDNSIGDITPPVSSINPFNNWYSSDFNSTFNDTDEIDGSGLHYKFYQVIDFDGTEWRANTNNGFFSDNFDNIIHSDWTQQTSAWTISNSFLQSADESESNTNIYAYINQDNANQFIYNWSGQLSGSGGNKRAGLHFMCSDPTLDQRGNSYMVYFRTAQNKIQIYESVDNVISLEADIDFTINENQWYDFKIIYDKLSGEISVLIDNILGASWIDSSPLLSGNSISFRGGNCIYDINNLKVYHDRPSTIQITVGATGDIRYQNSNSSTPSGRVKSIVIDSAKNVSALFSQNVNIDWTVPSNITYVNDGVGNDISVFTNNNSISANWNSIVDINSDISSYQYAIGTTPTTTDILSYTDNWFDTTMTHTGLSLVTGTTYFVHVKSLNGAGLGSNIIVSNGQTLEAPTNAPISNFTVSNTYICSTDSILFSNTSTDALTYIWSVPNAIPSSSIANNPFFSFPSTGSYTVTLSATGPGGTDISNQTVTIEVTNPIAANFTSNLDVVNINNPIVTFTNSSTNANGHFWDFGDGLTSIDTNPWHNYTQTGTFTVMYIAINGVCENDTAWTTIQVIDDVSLTENTEQFKVYPNPVVDNLTIELTILEQNTVVSVIDSRGRTISTENLKSKTHTIKTNHLESGLYFLKIISSERVLFNEFLKK